jgi:outer membrane scaffolding protein for murein synthesis (MipA/OmpV family)
MRRTTRVALLLLLASQSTTALAENPSPLPEWIYSAGIPLTRRFMDEIPKWQVIVGLSSEILPKYDGASRYHVLGGPMFDIRYKELAFLATGEGLGVNFFENNYTRVGMSITYDLGRSRSLSHELSRLSDVDPTPEAKVFGEVVLFPFVLRADIRRSMGGYNGWAGDFSAYMPIAGWKNRLFIFAGPAIAFGDRNYMQRYFGITPAESASSGLPVFMAGGGIKTVSFGADATWLMGHHWFLNIVAAGDCLIDDANRSPTTRNQVQGITGFTVAYRF